MDLFWRDTIRCPTEDEYLEMVGNKTGGLFRLAVRLMQAKSSSDKCEIFILFQMSLDDDFALTRLLGTVFLWSTSSARYIKSAMTT